MSAAATLQRRLLGDATGALFFPTGTVLAPGRVIRARAPLRLGLAGGGTDLSPYCDDFGGAVLNCTIDRYAYCFITASTDGMVHFESLDIGVQEQLPATVAGISTARLGIHAGVYTRFVRDHLGGRVMPLRITTDVQAPPGSGLGSSSALCVAMVEAFRGLLGLPMGPYDVAHLAFEIERIELGLPGGRQDQYAAAFGGANFIEFLPNDRVLVNPLRVSAPILCEFETSLVTCFTGVSRRSDAIISEQRRRMSGPGADSLASLHQLKSDAVEMKQAMLRGDVEAMARILNRSWEAKKRTASGVSNTLIDRLHAVGLGHGAMAGKVSGAGGGGFLMFIVKPGRRNGLIQALRAEGGDAASVQFTPLGCQSWEADRD